MITTISNNTSTKPPLSGELISQWTNPDYWRELCPLLTISKHNDDDKPITPTRNHQHQDIMNHRLQQRLIQDGYALINTSCSSNLQSKLAIGMSELETKYHLPATFVLLLLGDLLWNHIGCCFQVLVLLMMMIFHLKIVIASFIPQWSSALTC